MGDPSYQPVTQGCNDSSPTSSGELVWVPERLPIWEKKRSGLGQVPTPHVQLLNAYCVLQWDGMRWRLQALQSELGSYPKTRSLHSPEPISPL